MDNVPLQVKNFNNKVRAMNQANAKMVTLTSDEARNLHAEIYDLLATISNLTQLSTGPATVTTISMDGGGFK